MRKRWNQPGSLFAKPAPAPATQPKRRRFARFALWPLRLVNTLFLNLSTTIGALVLLAILFGAVFSLGAVQRETLPRHMILTMNIDEGLTEQNTTPDILSALENFGQTNLTTQNMIDAIDHAAHDPRVAGLAFTLSGGDFGITHVQELRAAIKRFRATGKPAWVYSPSYAEAGASMGVYYLAAAFDQIWMQPIGILSLPGFDAEMPFVADALRAIGVEPQFFQRKQYKTVMENIARGDMSPANREMMTSLLTDISNTIIADIAADRKISPATIREDIDQNIFTDQEALKARLIDHLDYKDSLFAALRQKTGIKESGHNQGLVNLAAYYGAMGRQTTHSLATRPGIALIAATGEIVSDNSGKFKSDAVTPGVIKEAFRAALQDPAIKIIVFRIASPGGSPTASETIRRTVRETIAAGKPVIVSMGSMAGSGGYWIATDATRIFALPATLTACIGVAGGRVSVAGLMDKLHVKWDGVQIGKNANMNALTKPFTESGRERMNAIMDSIYAAFINRVAQGRHMTPQQVEKIAKGRIWTGHQALSLGLVDQLGGLNAALDYAAHMIGLKDRTQAAIIPMPRPKTGVERLLDFFNIDVAMNNILNRFWQTAANTFTRISTPHVTTYDPRLNLNL